MLDIARDPNDWKPFTFVIESYILGNFKPLSISKMRLLATIVKERDNSEELLRFMFEGGTISEVDLGPQQYLL